MKEVISRLEKLGTRVLDEVEKRPLKTLLYGVLTIWIIGKAVKSLRD